MDSPPPEEPQPFQQTGHPGDVVGSRFQPVRQEIRHFRLSGQTARSSRDQGFSSSLAEEQPGSLGTIEPLVTRHRHKGRAPVLHTHRKHPGRLGGVHNKGNLTPPAQGGNLLHRQHIAEHVGHMGTDDHIHLRGQPPLQFLQKQIGTEERGPDHPQADIGNRRQRPGHRIVFISRQEHRGSRLYQGMHGNVQPMGGVEGQHHPLGLPHLEEGGGLLPAGQQRSGGPGRRAIGPSSRTGHGCHGPPDCPEYSRGLLIRGGGTVQIDHSSTSR